MERLKLKNMNVSYRLAGAFGAVVLLLVVISCLAWANDSSARSQDQASQANMASSVPRQRVMVDALRMGLDENSVAGDYLGHATTTGDLASFKADSASFLADYRADRDTYDSYEQPRRAAELDAYRAYVSISDQANAAFAAGQDTKAETLIAQLSDGSMVSPAQQLLEYQFNQTEHDDKAGISSATTGRAVTIVICLVAVLLAGLLAVWIVRSIKRPLIEAKRVLDLSAKGDLRPPAEVRSEDELGQMARSLNVQLDARQELIKTISDMSRGLATASEQLTSVSAQLASGSDQTAAEANTVLAAAEQVSANVSAVAAASEELAASIGEIARSASDASRVAHQGLEVAEATSRTVNQLNDSSNKIGEVVKLITSIAQQTNLLALNATIEAARAGEAGRGFAIVANEVKELAKETAKATEEISQSIEAIQGDSHATIDAISQIDQIMGKINQAQTSIASAVEQQTATTAEIGRTVNEAAGGSGEIARNIGQVAAAAQDATRSAASTQQAAVALSRMATEMESIVAGYQF